MVQALFFADGGLLALGCNIFNLGFFPAFIAYPLIYKKIIGSQTTATRLSIASICAAILGLQLGAFAVVLETMGSGISSLPFSTFAAMMQPIHLAIGIVEGVVTAAVVSFVYKARPEIMRSALEARPIGNFPVRTVLVSFLVVALLTGGVVSWFASEQPDGLEWSIKQVTGKGEVEAAKDGLHGALASLQKKVAFLPDYSFKKPEAAGKEAGAKPGVATASQVASEAKTEKPNKEGNKRGTSLSGILGGIITLVLAGMIGFVLKKRAQHA
jgi:cobalt/nickel transport system permease protein